MNFNKSIALGSIVFNAFQAYSTKPNIVLIVTDQQSYNTISGLKEVYGVNETYCSTPNIDRLVKNGVSFTRSYCANPISVPSRFAMFTGELGGKYNVRENTNELQDETQILALLQKSAMGNVFLRNGYQTYYSGKVHLPFAQRTSLYGRPSNYGFSEYLTDDDREDLGNISANFISKRTSPNPFLLVVSFINPHDICLESTTNLSNTFIIDPNKPEIAATLAPIRNEAASYDSIYFYQNIAPALPYNKDKTTGFPASFRKNQFVNYPDYYWQKYRWIYSRLVNLLDDHIGVVLDAIDQSPHKDNTIVIFTSDHGEMQGSHSTTTKNLPFEECMRVPFIISGKDIQVNQRDNSLVCNGTDLIPTMCELAGIPIPSNLKGISVANRVKYNTPVEQRKYLYLEGDNFSNIIDNEGYKLTRFHINGNPEMLIDLNTDKGELRNVSGLNNYYLSKTEQLSTILDSALITTNIQSTNASKIITYPNPTSDYIVVDGVSWNQKISIYNLLGLEVSSQVQLQFQEHDISKLQVSTLPKGMYVVNVGSYNSKFVIK